MSPGGGVGIFGWRPTARSALVAIESLFDAKEQMAVYASLLNGGCTMTEPTNHITITPAVRLMG